MDIHELGIRTTTDAHYAALLKEAYKIARQSKHPSTYMGALLVDKNTVVARGVNSLPPHVLELPERFEGKNKHIYPNHAERDAIFHAARAGVATNGVTIVTPWLPCILCANAIITAGLAKVVVHKQMIARTDEKWREELLSALQLLREAKIEVLAYDGAVGEEAYMHKKTWQA